MNSIAANDKKSQIINVLRNKKGVVIMKKTVFWAIFSVFLLFSCERESIELTPGSAEILEIQILEAELTEPNETENVEVIPEGVSDWIRTREQGVQLARMFVNEDDRPIRRKPNGTEGEMTIDHVMISRTVYTNRSTKKRFSNWMEVMKFLSPHVGRVKVSKRHRHEWTSQLPSYGDGPPISWIDCRHVDKGKRCDGDWRIHGKLWVKFREHVIRYWLDEDLYFMLSTEEQTSKPRHWGNRQDVIRFLSRHENLCVLGVGDRNFFLARSGEGCFRNDRATQAARYGRRPDETR